MNTIETLLKLGVKHAKLDIMTDDTGKATVFINIKSKCDEPALKDLKPFFITTDIERIDALLLEKLETPIKETVEFISNVEATEANRQQQALKTKAAQERKTEIKKAEDALKKIVTSDNYSVEKDQKKALKAIEKLKELEQDNSYAQKITKQLQEELASKNSLFN